MKKLLSAFIAFLFCFNLFASGTVMLNGKQIKNKEDLHVVIAKGLNFPSFYGKNLDALYDVLSNDTAGDSVIKIKSASILKQRIGVNYFDALLETINAASDNNPKVILILE